MGQSWVGVVLDWLPVSVGRLSLPLLGSGDATTSSVVLGASWGSVGAWRCISAANARLTSSRSVIPRSAAHTLALCAKSPNPRTCSVSRMAHHSTQSHCETRPRVCLILRKLRHFKLLDTRARLDSLGPAEQGCLTLRRILYVRPTIYGIAYKV